MGVDKGSLAYRDSATPQVLAAVGLVGEVCRRVFVSVNAQQAGDSLYAPFQTIVDTAVDRGPAGGLRSAFETHPTVAWLVVAVDMPLVTTGMLRALIEQRQPNRIATVLRHADGTIEPLCAIWERQSFELIGEELASGRGSLRALAEENSAAIAALPEPDRLDSANTPEERARMQQRVRAADTPQSARTPRS